ncbi:MAG: hypothetical protein OXC56_00395 [Chloroflexi bacterium]|nr:hypothetical protein [Chloroflexota bacterium]
MQQITSIRGRVAWALLIANETLGLAGLSLGGAGAALIAMFDVTIAQAAGLALATIGPPTGAWLLIRGERRRAAAERYARFETVMMAIARLQVDFDAHMDEHHPPPPGVIRRRPNPFLDDL